MCLAFFTLGQTERVFAFLTLGQTEPVSAFFDSGTIQTCVNQTCVHLFNYGEPVSTFYQFIPCFASGDLFFTLNNQKGIDISLN